MGTACAFCGVPGALGAPRRARGVPAKRARCARTRRASAPRATTAAAAAATVTEAADAAHMRRCVALALRAAGQTRPNPVVGCVLVGADGGVISEGWHARAGRAHAEAAALSAARAAGAAVAGATAYVNLEPCAHFGRTPPCADALVAARVARVVVGITDPDPRVAGRGLARLRAAGVDVQVGVERELCAVANEGFLWRVGHRAPFGTLKFAMTLDGKLATEAGSSRWVTGEAARGRVHAMRAAADAVVVGGATLRADDPRLTVRGGHSAADGVAPYRVVMTQGMDVDVDARMWNADADDEVAGQPVVLVDARHGRPGTVSELRARGVLVEEVPGLRPRDAMQFLYEKDCMNVMWECGGALAREALVDGAVQKVCAFVAPKIVGGSRATSPVDGDAICLDMGEAMQLERTKVEALDGGDFVFEGYLQQKG